jgi:hypothetical protein
MARCFLCDRRGEVSEWLKERASKACVPVRVPWVRIPPSPPDRICHPKEFPIGDVLGSVYTHDRRLTHQSSFHFYEQLFMHIGNGRSSVVRYDERLGFRIHVRISNAIR